MTSMRRYRVGEYRRGMWTGFLIGILVGTALTAIILLGGSHV
jgi:hypothetical protein